MRACRDLLLIMRSLFWPRAGDEAEAEITEAGDVDRDLLMRLIVHLLVKLCFAFTSC